MSDQAREPIFTARLSLTPARREDAPFMEALLADADVRAFLGGPVPAEERAQAIQSYLAGVTWVVASQAGPIGLVFHGQHRDTGEPEISYMFARHVWGQGFAAEALTAWMSNGSGTVVAETQAANFASVRLLRRLGFHEVSRFERFGAEQLLFRKKGPTIGGAF